MKSNPTPTSIAPAKVPQLSYRVLKVVSAGGEDGDLKDQDRANYLICANEEEVVKYIAIICDGISQSPDSEKAAEHVSIHVQRLYEENGISSVARELLEMREATMYAPIHTDPCDPPALKALFEEIITRKRACSYQTTFISACIERKELSPDPYVLISVLGCGDSAVFLFTDCGNLLYNNLGLEDENDSFTHLSPITEALPDSYDESKVNILSHSQVLDDGVQLLLCSDGFYDSFSTFGEIYCWLNENRLKLSQEESLKELTAELHSKLLEKKGDDDVSFIWLAPQSEPEEIRPVETSRQSTQAGSEISDVNSTSVGLKRFQLFRWFLCLFGFKALRFL